MWSYTFFYYYAASTNTVQQGRPGGGTTPFTVTAAEEDHTYEPVELKSTKLATQHMEIELSTNAAYGSVCM